MYYANQEASFNLSCQRVYAQSTGADNSAQRMITDKLTTFVASDVLSGDVAVYNALMGLLLVVLSIVLFMMGVVLQQGNMIQREVWLLQQGRKSTRFYLAGPEEHQFEEINP